MGRERTWAELIAAPFWWVTSLLLGPMSSARRARELAEAERQAYDEDRRRRWREEERERTRKRTARIKGLAKEARTPAEIDLLRQLAAGALGSSQPRSAFLDHARRAQQQAPRGSGGLGGLLGGGMSVFGRWI